MTPPNPSIESRVLDLERRFSDDHAAIASQASSCEGCRAWVHDAVDQIRREIGGLRRQVWTAALTLAALSALVQVLLMGHLRAPVTAAATAQRPPPPALVAPAAAAVR